MGTINNEYDGVHVKIFKVTMDAGETSLDVPHNLNDFVTTTLQPKDAGFYTQQVLLDTSDTEKVVLAKTAGASAEVLLTCTVINAPRNG